MGKRMTIREKRVHQKYQELTNYLHKTSIRINALETPQIRHDREFNVYKVERNREFYGRHKQKI